MKLRPKLSDDDAFLHHAFVHESTYNHLFGIDKSEPAIVAVSAGHWATCCFLGYNDKYDPEEIQLPAGLGIDPMRLETVVEVARVDISSTPTAREIVFEHEGSVGDFSETRTYFENVFSSWSLPIYVGQIILERARVRGESKSFTFRVCNINGSSTHAVARIDKATEIRMTPNQIAEPGVRDGFGRVGGLEKEINIIRDIIKFQFDRKDELKRLGLRPTKGILLTGPPGTGKTLIARSIAREFGVNPYSLNATELLSEFVGTGERRLREIFGSARKQSRSIIFIDEIDVLTASRDAAQEDFSRRLVNQFLPLMDGIEDSENVTVIGATNRPHAIDPAFRRPGRFDQELALSIPSPQALRAIFEVHIDRFDKQEIDLDRVVAECAGFVGADVEAAVRNTATYLLKGKKSTALTTEALIIGARSIVPALKRHFEGEIYFPGAPVIKPTEDKQNAAVGPWTKSIHDLFAGASKAGRPRILLFDTGSLVSDHNIGLAVAEASGLVTVQLDGGITSDENRTFELLRRVSVYFHECAIVFGGCHFAGIQRGLSLLSKVQQTLRSRCRLVVYAGTHFENNSLWREMVDGAIERASSTG